MRWAGAGRSRRGASARSPAAMVRCGLPPRRPPAPCRPRLCSICGRCCAARAAALHLRLRGALLGAVRLALLDGGVLRLRQGASGPGGAPLALVPGAIAAIANLFGPAASVLGNELAMRYGRGRLIAVAMIASGVFTCLLGLALGPALVCDRRARHAAHGLHMGDSSALTAGMVVHSPPEARGATMALHSMLGFGAGLRRAARLRRGARPRGRQREPVGLGRGLCDPGRGGVLAPWLLGFARLGERMPAAAAAAARI